MKLLLSILSFALASLLKPATAAGQDVTVAPGLTEREFSCESGSQRLHFHELRADLRHGLEFRALGNPSAHADHQCPSGYGGVDISGLVASLPGLDVLGVTNGNFFQQTAHGFVSTGFLWSGSISSLGSGGVLLAPVTRRGRHVVVIAPDGAHEEDVHEGESSERLLARLRASHPSMTFAAQLSMPLLVGGPAPCTAGSPHWQCGSLPRTLLCGRTDGTVSLLTTQAALTWVASGLRPGGSCRTECRVLYNLDGGGSTQLGYVEPRTGDLVVTGTRLPAGTARACGEHRPVDDYFAIVRAPGGTP